jgi:hypothetical protein
MVVLKAFSAKEYPWLGFRVPEVAVTDWAELRPALKQRLQEYISSKVMAGIARRIAGLAMVILAVDKFVDFQGERCNLLVRDVAGEIVARAMLGRGLFGVLAREECVAISRTLFRDMMDLSRSEEGPGSGWETRLSILNVAVKVMELDSQDPGRPLARLLADQLEQSLQPS